MMTTTVIRCHVHVGILFFC